MTLLTTEQLKKLPTKRLLAYKKKLWTHCVPPSEYGSECQCGTCISQNKASEEWYKHLDDLKTVLATREHIPNENKQFKFEIKDKVKIINADRCGFVAYRTFNSNFARYIVKVAWTNGYFDYNCKEKELDYA